MSPERMLFITQRSMTRLRRHDGGGEKAAFAYIIVSRILRGYVVGPCRRGSVPVSGVPKAAVPAYSADPGLWWFRLSWAMSDKERLGYDKVMLAKPGESRQGDPRWPICDQQAVKGSPMDFALMWCWWQTEPAGTLTFGVFFCELGEGEGRMREGNKQLEKRDCLLVVCTLTFGARDTPARPGCAYLDS